ncbi:MAG: hypothetical protein B7C24_01220 [Bacteroidetes bacterium 4572_77]|nr:MAG: hypothetical protein B7C24_01220 [Bacteroidetes bacterium 4572_77]
MKQIFSYFFALLKILSIAKILNLFKLYSSFFYAKITGHIIHKGSPWSLSIETGTSCNLSCLECPSGQKQFSRPTGYLSLQDFKTIIQKQKKYLIWLILYFQGEPYMNRDFFAMVKYAKLLKIFTTSSTNGHFLNKSNAKKTIESGLDQIIISLDGATKKFKIFSSIYYSSVYCF